MRNLWILAAAAFLAVGCAGRNEDETGAAPDRGDAAVTATDTAAVQTDSTMGAVPEATVTDSSAVMTDTTSAEASMGVDSVGAQGEVQTTDSTAWTADSTSVDAPADSTANQ
jgi:hypothetical protein